MPGLTESQRRILRRMLIERQHLKDGVFVYFFPSCRDTELDMREFGELVYDAMVEPIPDSDRLYRLTLLGEQAAREVTNETD